MPHVSQITTVTYADTKVVQSICFSLIQQNFEVSSMLSEYALLFIHLTLLLIPI